MEGSCVEIKCLVTLSTRVPRTAHWFWIKDGEYVDDKKSYEGTILYSTSEAQRPVSPQFKDRVEYTGSPSASWNTYVTNPQYCSILICQLNKTDSGKYQFRFVENELGTNKWITQNPSELIVTGKFKSRHLTFILIGEINKNKKINKNS